MANRGWRSEDKILVGIIIGVIAGVFCGLVFGERMEYVAFIGDMFMRSLRVIVIPLIIATMVTGITSLGDVRKLGPMGLTTLGYYLVTTTIAVTVGLLFTNLIRPGIGTDLTTDDPIPDAVQNAEVSFLNIIVELIPRNIFDSMANTDVLPVIVCSLFFGAVLTTIGKEGEVVRDFFVGFNSVMMKIVHIIMWTAPVGVFALIASTLGSSGTEKFASLIWFIVTVLLGLGVHSLITIPLILFFVAGRNPLSYAKGMLSAMMTAFSTSSSAATLPITMECVEENNKIKPQTASFVLPIGATVNMDGTALYMGCSVLFLAQAYGVDLTILQQMLIFLTTVFGSIGAAAIPSASLVLLVPILQSVNLPIDGIALIFAIDWFLDRWRTVTNIWGDSAGCAVVERFVGHTLNTNDAGAGKP